MIHLHSNRKVTNTVLCTRNWAIDMPGLIILVILLNVEDFETLDKEYV